MTTPRAPSADTDLEAGTVLPIALGCYVRAVRAAARLVAALVALPALAAVGPASPALALPATRPASVATSDSLPLATANENRRPAGRMVGDTLVLRLDARLARWRPDGDRGRAWEVYAFAERGKAPSVPGPLLRVRAGTPVQVSVRNALPADTLWLWGLAARGTGELDSAMVLPGRAREFRFVASGEGNYLYWGAALRRKTPFRQMRDAHLTGAMIVDAARGTPKPDRVVVITGHYDTLRADGGLVRGYRGVPVGEVLALNGRAWPHTERMTHTVGDSVRWRVLSGSSFGHPMHLHGFYFRIDRRGVQQADTGYAPAERRMAVTEMLRFGNTMSIVWRPDRPGGWIFHCHITFHIAARPDGAAGGVPASHAKHDPDTHTFTGMGGLLLAVTVHPRGRPPVERGPARTLRLVVLSDSAAGDPWYRYGFALQRGDAEPTREAMSAPGPTLVLTRGEPTEIQVVNRMHEPTAIHWHGIELESYYDGVVGFGGTPGRVTPAIRPGRTMRVRMTPLRAGSFMYHTHFNELTQQLGGLYGGIVVLEPGEVWDPAHDHVLVITEKPDQTGGVLNGETTGRAMALAAGSRHRFRFMNIGVSRPFSLMRLTSSGAPARWRVVAKDGWALDPARAREREAVERVGTGETMDVEWLAERGDYVLQLTESTGTVLATVPIIVR